MAKVNHHHDVCTVLQKAGGMLPDEHSQPTDKSDSYGNDSKQISMLNRMIVSLFHLLTILCTKVDVMAKFPNIKDKIDQLRMVSENITQYDETKFQSLEQTIEDVFDMNQWASQTSDQDQGTDQTAHILTLEKHLSEVGSELTNVKSQLEDEQRQNSVLIKENKNQLSEIRAVPLWRWRVCKATKAPTFLAPLSPKAPLFFVKKGLSDCSHPKPPYFFSKFITQSLILTILLTKSSFSTNNSRFIDKFNRFSTNFHYFKQFLG